MTAGVSAYKLYHQDSVQKYLGVQGEALASAYAYDGETYFDNENVSLTLDTVMYDGHTMYAVVTIEAKDPDYRFQHDYHYMPEIFCDAEGNSLLEWDGEGEFVKPDKPQTSASAMWHDTEMPASQCRFVMSFPNAEAWDGQTVYYRYARPDDIEYEFAKETPGRKLLDGMMISLRFQKNCDCFTYTAENGDTVYFSDIALKMYPRSVEETVTLIGTDGSRMEVYPCSGFSTDDGGMETTTLATTTDKRSPDFTNVFRSAEIAAIEINGVRYTR